MTHQNNILTIYQAKADLLSKEIKDLKRVINQFSISRLVVFFLGIFAVYFLFDYGLNAAILIGLLTLVAFLFLVKIQVKKQEILSFKSVKLELLQNEINIINGKENVYDNGDRFQNPMHAYSSDLDVFGVKSLYAYVNRCFSAKAINLLASWLEKPATKTEIINRQIAAEELTALSEKTLDFRTRLFILNKNHFSYLDSFISNKLGGFLSFLSAKGLIVFVQITPLISCGVLLLAIVLGGVWWSVFALVLIFSGLGYSLFKKHIDYLHEVVGKTAAILFNYSENLKWIETHNWKSNYLQEKVQAIKSTKPVYLELNELAKIIKNLDYRANIIVGTFLNLLFQWDLRCLLKLQDWEQRNSSNLLKSFDLMSEFEALISISTLNYNHPEWVLPKINSQFCFKTTELGHPLIAEEKRINNNFELKDYPTVDVITGSNMAGKSTFLRTVGVNMVLAFAGFKVCAKTFETSIFNLLSYMRIKDSLIDDTSTFKAEINRLKMILDTTFTDKNAFVLIDEMLRGTNSRDKYLGSKVFIKKLISQSTPGFIATHDLQIAELETEYPDKLRNYHFDIQVKGEEMYFDYIIKKGECNTFNASILLKAIGLNVDNE